MKHKIKQIKINEIKMVKLYKIKWGCNKKQIRTHKKKINKIKEN